MKTYKDLTEQERKKFVDYFYTIAFIDDRENNPSPWGCPWLWASYCDDFLLEENIKLAAYRYYEKIKFDILLQVKEDLENLKDSSCENLNYHVNFCIYKKMLSNYQKYPVLKKALFCDVMNAFKALDEVKWKFPLAHIMREYNIHQKTVFLVRLKINDEDWARTLEDDDLVLGIGGTDCKLFKEIGYPYCALKDKDFGDTFYEIPLDYKKEGEV